jgi:hypothetical protein
LTEGYREFYPGGSVAAASAAAEAARPDGVTERDLPPGKFPLGHPGIGAGACKKPYTREAQPGQKLAEQLSAPLAAAAAQRALDVLNKLVVAGGGAPAAEPRLTGH